MLFEVEILNLAASSAKFVEDKFLQRFGLPTHDGSACGQRGTGFRCILVNREAALPADMITWLIFEYLE